MAANLYCKRQCLPFQLTAHEKLTEYLCCFSIIKEYAQEEYHTRLTDTVSGYLKLTQLLEEKAADALLSSKTFSTQELRILKRYAAGGNTTCDAVAASFKIQQSTVGTYNKRILAKSKKSFHQPFEDARKVAAYLRRMRLL